MRRSFSLGGLIGTLFLLFAGCSGGGGSGPAVPLPAPVQFELLFPGNSSLTNAGSTDVVGVADANRVTAVTVKTGNSEIVAVMDTAGRWRADAVPLQPGANNLAVELTLADGSVSEREIGVVRSSPVLSLPTGVRFDGVNNRVLIADAKKLLAFDISTQATNVISSRLVGNGPGFSFAQHLELAGDGAILVPDAGHIKRVDPITGDRSEYIVFSAGAFTGSTIARDEQLDRLFAVGFSNSLHVADLTEAPPILAASVGTPPPFGIGPASLPSDSTYVSGTDTVYAVNRTTLNVIAIDGSTGDVANQAVEQGGLPTPTVGIDYDEVGDQVLVLGLSGGISAIDPNSGVSSVQVPAPVSATPFKAIQGLTRGDGSLWTVSSTSGELIRINSTSGAQTVEFDSSVGGGAAPGLMLAARFDESGDRIVAVADLRIVAINPATGVREELAMLFDPFIGAGPPPGFPGLLFVSGITLSQDGARAWVVGALSGELAEVNLVSGEV
ncbi:MAG: hypothetical protein OEM63_06855, partial [Gammaproteobacteria bacterium]|nr:hypothetical protein [Gammaproteobacteria bacterium]